MRYLISLLLATVIMGCNKDQVSPEIEKGLFRAQALITNGISRNYHIHIPNNPENAPVIFLFHGGGSDYDDMLGFTGVKAPYKVWLDIALEENLIIVVPNGTLGSNNVRGWNDCRTDAPTNPSSNDVKFIVDLLDFVETEYRSNPKKVFALGTSNGGHFSMRLAQEIPDRLTAFASVVASMPVNSSCVTSTAKVSALFMNGTDDPLNPYNGGSIAFNRGEVFSTENSVAYWVERNETDTTPEIVNPPDVNTSDGSTVSASIYRNGGDNTEVALYQINNGGHTEPSIVERYSSLFLLTVGSQNGDIEMANEIWSFFEDKTK